MIILSSSTSDKSLEIFESIFKFKNRENVNYKSSFKQCVNFESIFEFSVNYEFLLMVDELTTMQVVKSKYFRNKQSFSCGIKALIKTGLFMKIYKKNWRTKLATEIYSRFDICNHFQYNRNY